MVVAVSRSRLGASAAGSLRNSRRSAPFVTEAALVIAPRRSGLPMNPTRREAERVPKGRALPDGVPLRCAVLGSEGVEPRRVVGDQERDVARRRRFTDFGERICDRGSARLRAALAYLAYPTRHAALLAVRAHDLDTISGANARGSASRSRRSSAPPM